MGKASRKKQRRGRVVIMSEEAGQGLAGQLEAFQKKSLHRRARIMTGGRLSALAARVPEGFETKGWSVAERLLILASLVAVAIFVVVGIGRPVWQDEAATIQISSQPFAGIVESLRRENNFPLYFFLLSIWIRVFGDSEIALRVLSGIFYLAGGAAAFTLGLRVSSARRGAWYSAYLCSPLAILQAQNIRTYSLLGLLSALSTLFLIRLFFDNDRSWKTSALFLLVNAVGILTHVWFAFVRLRNCWRCWCWSEKRCRRASPAC